MSMTNYTVMLPDYSIGENCYEKIGMVTRHFAKKVVIIGGKTALEKAKPAIMEAIQHTPLTVLDTIWYGGNASTDNIDALVANETVQQGDIIFGVGGGRALDTCKVVADKLNKPLLVFPTVASNCAACTAVSVVYNPDGTLHSYYYPAPAVHTFIHTGIIADSPEDLFWAGIGDTLAKECEAELASRNDQLFHTTLLGIQVSHCCTSPILEYGEQAYADFKAKKVTFALQQVILDIIMSTGIVSNLTCGGEEYYYNSSLAHCFYNASTVLPQSHRHLHGEIVSFGVLVLLTYDGQTELRNTIAAFNKRMGLPTTLADLDITTEEDLDALVNKAPSIMEWKKVPSPITTEAFKQAILDADAYGKTL